MIDIEVRSDDRGGFDISIDPATGDLALTAGFDTSLKMSLFEERRANREEMVPSERRRGWWGNTLFSPSFEVGSKLWLLDQARLTQETLNKAIDYARTALQWLVTDGHLESIEVSGRIEAETIVLTIDLFRSGSKIDSFAFDIWQATERDLG